VLSIELPAILAVLPLLILAFSIGVATTTIRHHLKVHEEKLDIILKKQDSIKKEVIEHKNAFIVQRYTNAELQARLRKLEQP